MPNPFDEFHSMLWQRDWYQWINYDWLSDRIIVHGHTPITKDEMNAMLIDIKKNQYVDIDCGCVHKGKQGLEYLACLILNEMKIVFVETQDF